MNSLDVSEVREVPNRYGSLSHEIAFKINCFTLRRGLTLVGKFILSPGYGPSFIEFC